MLKRLSDLLAIRPGEGRLAGLLVGVMVFTSAGSAVGSAGIDTLFFTRFGVQYLPYMYMLLGLVTMGASLSVTAWLGRVPARRLYVILPLLLGLLLLGSRLLLLLELRLIFPILWLGKEVINTLIGFTVWGAASVVCDARQARRLFPLFGAGRILGSVLGGLLTASFASLTGADNLVLFWVGAMLLAFLFSRMLLGAPQRRSPIRRPSRDRAPGFIREVRQGWQYIRGSLLMRWIAAASVLFSVLFFSLALPFSRTATLQYPNEAALAGFLGFFQGLSTAAAFMVSLFLANRLFARFGIMTMILGLTLVYLLGFGAMALAPVFVVIVSFRFVQMIWLSGIADSAWQAMFNVVPPARRDQVRTFMGGVPDQAGTFLAGLVLLLGEQTFTPGQTALIGLAAAAACVYMIWQAGRAYRSALVDALRAGRPQVFLDQHEPFGGFRHDSTARGALIAGTRAEDLFIRRVSTEILGQVQLPEAVDALINALYDPDALVRIHALRALALAPGEAVTSELLRLLADPDAEVRLEALRSLQGMDLSVDRLLPALERLLDDPVLAVRIRAAAARLKLGHHAASSELLRASLEARDENTCIAALQVIPGDPARIAVQLGHSQPAVRRAAASALRRVAGMESLPALIALLSDPEVSGQAAREIGLLGPGALPLLFQTLDDPASEAGALTALAAMPGADLRPLEAFARKAAAQARHYEGLRPEGLRPGSRASDPGAELLDDLLREKARLHARHALQAVGLLTGREAAAVALENLTSEDAGQRAAALETLESLGGHWRETIRPLLALWDETSPHTGHASAAPSSDLLVDPDPLVRQVAAFALNGANEVNEVNGDTPMHTLSTLSMMERVLFFRRVPLFEGLSTADLKNVADLSEEAAFSEGEEIAAQDEPGDTMYLVVSGEIIVRTTGPGGKGREIARRGPGDCVGEMALISNMPRMASLIAAGDVRTLTIGQKSFHGLLRERPEVSLAVMKELCARVTQLAHYLDA